MAFKPTSEIIREVQNDEAFVRASEVEMKSVDWLWPNHLARKKITMLAGDPELGKSQIATNWAAVLTKIGVWPDGTAAPRGSVIILSAKDSIEDIIVPRLDAAGANLALVHCLRFVRDEQGRPRSFSIQQDLEILAHKVRAIGDVAMVIIDPVTAYLGSKLDSHKITDVRAALYPLAQFTDAFNVATIGVAHPPKAPSAKAINFIGGSGAFTAAPRLVFMTIIDPERRGRNLLLPVKNNIGRKAAGRGYSIVSALVGPNENILTSRVEWDSRPVTMTADEALAAHADKHKAKTEAEDFLRTKMAPGQSYPASDIQKEAEAAGIAERTLRRASDDLDIKKSRNGFGPGSRVWWSRDD